jgi:hypothetical protein
MIKRLATVALAFAVASCGSVSDLEPQVGKSLPPKPAFAVRAMTAEELLELPPQADPRRVDELGKRGDIRERDRFDLPPPDGEAVPPLIDEPSTASTTGPDSQEPRRR